MFAWDFWAETGAIVSNGKLSLSALPLGANEVIGLTPIDGETPALIASDRHVSMDAVSVTGCEWKFGRFALSLRGFAGLTARYFVYGPALKGEVAQASGAQLRPFRAGTGWR